MSSSRRWLVFFLLLLAPLVSGCGGGGHHHLHGGRTRAPSFGKPPPNDFGLKPSSPTAVPFIPGLDAVTISNIPLSTRAVGCYASGRYANCSAARARFPLAHLISIATWVGASARCLDVEPGDATPVQVPGWLHAMLHAGVQKPCVYSDASEFAQIRVYVGRAGIPNGVWFKWLADWDHNPAIPVGYDAKQWDSNCCVDRDSFATYFFGVPPKPKPKPTPKCLAKKWPHTKGCRLVRYGYHHDQVDLRKLNRLIAKHGCHKRKHPSYCRGWLHWQRIRSTEVKQLRKKYA